MGCVRRIIHVMIGGRRLYNFFQFLLFLIQNTRVFLKSRLNSTMGRKTISKDYKKMKKWGWNQKYLSNPDVLTRTRESNRLKMQERRRRERMTSVDPRISLINTRTRAETMRHINGEEEEEEEEEEAREPMIDADIAIEEEGEILEGFAGSLDEGDWDDGGFDDGGGFPDEPESGSNSDMEEEFTDEPEPHDEGNGSMKTNQVDDIARRVKEEEDECTTGPMGLTI
jgi:hypothetical protein